MQRLLIIVLLAGAATLAGGLSYQYWEQRHPRRLDFSLQDLQQQSREASDFDGQLVLLNFWAPWCAPCRAEIPMLNELQADYGERGLQILGPAVDQREAVEDFQQQTPIGYPVLLGLPQILRLQDGYGEQRLPFSVLVGRNGRVIYRHAGELKRADIAPLIEENL